MNAAAVLPGGHPVDGAADLADYLIQNKGRQFARALTSKMLAYALGRSLGRQDDKELDELTSRFEEAGYRLRELCTIIVTSDSFRRR